MTEFEMIIDFHRDGERQGPGSAQETLKALELTGLSNHKDLKIADIGCGTGSQTLTLAEHILGEIIAVDLFDEFLDELNSRAVQANLQDRITTINRSMEDLPFENAEFDILWSEGAIYIMGFEAGIQKWRKHLKSGGYLAISEATWFTSSRPVEIEEFWNREYSEMDTASGKIKTLEANGYTLEGYFPVSESSWLEEYYLPMEERFDKFLEKHNHSEIAVNVVEEHKQEIELYRQFKSYYGYGFYVARKL